MSKLKSLISELEKRASQDESFEELSEQWKSKGVSNSVEDFIKQGFKAIKLYEELMRPMHGHPDLKNSHSQMSEIYECLMDAKTHTEKAIAEWRRFQSVL